MPRSKQLDAKPLAAWYPDAERRHTLHYDFVHIYLRDRFFDNPGHFISRFLGELEAFAIQVSWQLLEEAAGGGPITENRRLREAGTADSLAAISDLTVEVRPGFGCTIALITLPPPEEPTCAFFVAAVVPARDSVSGGPDRPRFFTLEIANSVEGILSDTILLEEGKGFLCEWFEDGARCQHEKRVPAVDTVFLHTIEAIIRKEAKLEDN